MRVRVGFSGSVSGIDIEMEDSESFIKDVENALDGGRSLVWVDNLDGDTFGVAVANITYIHLEGDTERMVGFA